MPRMPRLSRFRLMKAGIITLQWLLLTISLGAVVVYSSDALDGLLSAKLDGSLIFFAAFIAAFILGMSIDSFKVLMAVSILMCLGASIVFAIVVLAPTYAGVTIRTTQLENYITTRMFLFVALMFLPAVVGAGFGNLAGGYIGDDMPEDDLQKRGAPSRDSWYERRRSPSSSDTKPL